MKPEIKTLTALRGVAAIWVVAYHYFRHFSSNIPGLIIDRGYLAVDTFFVLSGFVMYYVYVEEFRAGRFQYANFLKKRLARLYPVHLTTTLAAASLFVISSALGLFDNVTQSLASIPFHLLLLHAWGLNDQLYLNYPSWSISAEFFAYMLLPILMHPFLNFRLRIVIPLVFSGAVFGIFLFNSYIAPSLGRETIFQATFDFSTLRIVPEFAMGLAAAKFSDEEILPVPKLFSALIFFSGLAALFFGEDVYFVLLMPIFIAALSQVKIQVPAWAIFLGKISFSVYMTHALTEMVLFRSFEVTTGVSDGQFPIFLYPAFILASLVPGWLCWKFVEEPGRIFTLRILTKGESPAPSKSVAS